MRHKCNEWLYNKILGENENEDMKQDNYEDLKREYDRIGRDIVYIDSMNVSTEAKSLIIKELMKQSDKIKEQMHAVIDALP